MTEKRKQNRGFANMDPAKQREIASKGGKAAHQKGTAHEWDSRSASRAGKLGGRASHGGRGRRPPTEDSNLGMGNTFADDIAAASRGNI